MENESEVEQAARARRIVLHAETMWFLEMPIELHCQDALSLASSKNLKTANISR